MTEIENQLLFDEGISAKGRTIQEQMMNLDLKAAYEHSLKQSHVLSVDGTETPTPGYVLVNLSAGSDLTWRGRKIAELYVIADNLLNQTYQSHLSRLKYADVNNVTGRQGVYNMGRNITVKLVVPINIL